MCDFKEFKRGIILENKGGWWDFKKDDVKEILISLVRFFFIFLVSIVLVVVE